MPEDNRNFIDQVQSRSVGYTGKELSPGEMATEFAKWDIGERVKALEEINADQGELTVGEAAKLNSYETALRNTHEKLRKVGR